MGKYSRPGTGPEKDVNPAEQEDVFVARMLTFSEWAQKNRSALTVGSVVAVLAVAALIYYGNYRESLNVAAAAQLEQLQQRLEQGDQAGAQADLQLYVQRFSGTPFADEARVSLAQITASMGDSDAAADVLEPVAGDVDNPLGAQAAGLLAAISEDAGNLQVAEGLYERLADRAELGFQVQDALADAARVKRDQGDIAGALVLYDRLLEEMDETDPGRGVVEMRRAEVIALLR